MSISTMMRTLSYILFSSLLILAPLTIQAKDKNEKEKDTTYKFFSFNGIGVQADVFGYVY